MRLRKFEAFYKQYCEMQTEAMQYVLLKDFTLSLPLDDLLAWNDFMGEN